MRRNMINANGHVVTAAQDWFSTDTFDPESSEAWSGAAHAWANETAGIGDWADWN